MLVERLLDSLTDVLSEASALHEPEFGGNDWTYLRECIDTGWVSSVGKFVDRFEADLASFTGARRAIAVVNGTAALHVALQLAGVEAGDEVLVPALTFVATANAVRYCGAIPHFVDSEEGTLGVGAARLAEYLEVEAEWRNGHLTNRRTGRTLRALVAVHVLGHPVDLEGIVAVCDRFHLTLIEDAAESLGSWYKGRHTGTFGRLAALSFNGNKIITTGGGGAVLTSDSGLGEQAKHLTTTAKRPHKWEYFHDSVGYNYRLPNLNAALGCSQLERLPDLLVRKRELARRYKEALKSVEGVSFVMEPKEARSNYWLNAITLAPGLEVLQSEILAATHARGLETRPPWTLLADLPMYSTCPKMDLSVAASLAKRLVCLPSSPKLVAAAGEVSFEGRHDDER